MVRFHDHWRCYFEARKTAPKRVSWRTVNLLTYVYAGSNPALPTSFLFDVVGRLVDGWSISLAPNWLKMTQDVSISF